VFAVVKKVKCKKLYLCSYRYLFLSVNNQDRVRKCGGFEIFIKKLKTLVTGEGSTGPNCVSQLLGTIDACIADNGV